MDYGLWLLIGLLVIIGLVFLLSGKDKAQDAPQDIAPTPPAQTPPAALVEPTPAPPIAAPVEPVAAPIAPIAPIATAPEPAPEPMPVSPAATAAPAASHDSSLPAQGCGAGPLGAGAAGGGTAPAGGGTGGGTVDGPRAQGSVVPSQRRAHVVGVEPGHPAAAAVEQHGRGRPPGGAGTD